MNRRTIAITVGALIFMMGFVVGRMYTEVVLAYAY